MSMNGNDLGDLIYSAVKTVEETQDTNDESVAQARFRAIGTAIVAYISAHATIAPLTTTSTPAGTGPHVHTPVTVIATGKIS